MTIESLRSYIELKKQQIADLEKRYGTGVRPSWVGEEIMILIHYQRDAEDQLKQLEANNATD
jgi:hypothetical protein